MAETSSDLGSAVGEVLDWLGTTPETAAAALGINVGTLNAMRQGIVPMRSLVIRFAQGIARRCEEKPGAPEWWREVDTWLAKAGYTPRRDGPPAPLRAAGWEGPPLPDPPPDRPVRQAGTPNGAPPDDPTPAHEYYRPSYERMAWGQTFVHIFWILDPDGRKVFRRHMNAQVDYKAEAARLKQDLARLNRTQFERKYGRFRVQGE
jgi:hypothetical protein